MKRRQALKLLMAPLLFSSPMWWRFGKAMAGNTLNIQDDDYVLLYDARASSPAEFIERLSPYLSIRDSDWQNKLKLLDVHTNQFEVADFMFRFGRNTSSPTYPMLVSVKTSSANDENPDVEVWTPQWLEHSKYFIENACYPVSSGWWSVEGDWNPSINKVRGHLFHSPNHTGGHFEKSWLDQLKYAELQSLHSDHHREMTNQGRVIWANVNAECQVGH